MKREIEVLKKKLHEKDLELQEIDLRTQSDITGLNKPLALTKFFLDRFKQYEGHFKFYIGFETYEMFSTFYTFLQLGASDLILLAFCSKYLFHQQ